MKGVRSRSEIRRHELQGKLQRPEAAKNDTHQVKTENQKSSEQHQKDTEMIPEVR